MPRHRHYFRIPRMTQRPQNYCKACGYTWYPRGKAVSWRCPRCGGTQTAAFSVGCWPALLVLLVLGVCGALANHSSPPWAPTGAPATAIPSSPASATRPRIGAANAVPPTTALLAAHSTPTIPRSPTAQPGPSFGSTVTLDQWAVSLAQLDLRAGQFLVWVDGRNLRSTPDTLATRFQWTLEDAGGHALVRQTNAAAASTVQRAGRDLLGTSVRPQALTHPLLVFAAPRAARPAALVIRGSGGVTDTARFDLSAWVAPPPVPPTPRPPTTTPRPTKAPVRPTPTPQPAPPVVPVAPSGGRIGAICRDGWHSSATGRGACSHHGGVAYWLYGP